jgi:3'-phosphoadenosine 5'-phosphosulfate sulfotransferase (PAPS reductase)/FAD synthetase
MHVDTGLNFPEVIDFRDRWVAELGVELIVASVPEAMARGTVREEPNGSRNRIQTPVLLEATEQHGFDALFGGARRDEEFPAYPVRRAIARSAGAQDRAVLPARGARAQRRFVLVALLAPSA